MEFASETFLHHRQWLKTIQGDGVNVTFSFLSSLSCGMVWVEEQKNNACKFPFFLIS